MIKEYKQYIKPELEIFKFDTEDEITTSIYERGTYNMYNEHLTDKQQQTNIYGTESFVDEDLWQ